MHKLRNCDVCSCTLLLCLRSANLSNALSIESTGLQCASMAPFNSPRVEMMSSLRGIPAYECVPDLGSISQAVACGSDLVQSEHSASSHVDSAMNSHDRRSSLFIS
eukprot:362536-Chlamydomonas_euryale.AAC.8